MPVKLLSHPKAIFIHIPKTGGKSVLNAWGAETRTPTAKGYIPPEWDIESTFSFAFVRHPIERLVSAYNMFSHGTKRIIDGKIVQRRVALLEGISFESFVEKVLFEDDREQQWSVTIHTLPQTDDWNLLSHADMIGRYENYASDFEAIAEAAGLRDYTLNHIHASEKTQEWQDIWANLNPSLKHQVNKYYAQDFKELNYEPL